MLRTMGLDTTGMIITLVGVFSDIRWSLLLLLVHYDIECHFVLPRAWRKTSKRPVDVSCLPRTSLALVETVDIPGTRRAKETLHQLWSLLKYFIGYFFCTSLTLTSASWRYEKMIVTLKKHKFQTILCQGELAGRWVVGHLVTNWIQPIKNSWYWASI